VKRCLHEMSIQFNMDKKQLLKRFFFYLISVKRVGITVDNLSVIEMCMHNTEVSAEQQIGFFLAKWR
jgi:hypothetical protein